MYLIWLYAFRWLGGFGGEGGNIASNAAQETQLNNIHSLTQSVAQSVNDGKFTQQQVQADLRQIQTLLCQGFGNMNTEILKLTNGIENSIQSCCCALQNKIDSVGSAVKENAYIIKDAIKESVIVSDRNFCELNHNLQDKFAHLDYNLAQKSCELNANNARNTRDIIDAIRQEGSATREQVRSYHDEAIVNELNTYKTKANNAELLSSMERFVIANYKPNA